MHRFFDIPELVLELCQYCSDSDQATLGRTARLFDCALDLLWRDLDDSKLFQCFPSGVVTERSLLRPMKPSDWERFNFYAKRVKTFFLISTDSTLLRTILQSAPSVVILPNLSGLAISVSFMDHVRSFLHCGLERLTLVCEGFSPQPDVAALMDSLFPSLPTLCPNLTHFIHPGSFTTSSPEGQYSPSSTAFVGQLVHLRGLHLPRLSTDDFPIFSRLPKLAHLSLEHIDDGIASPLPNPQACCSLSKLQVTGHPNQILKLTQYLSTRHLESLSITVPIESGLGITRVTRTLASRGGREMLRTLTVNFRISPKQPTFIPAVDEAASFDCLSPLFNFPNVEDFRSSVFPELSLGDDFITKLAQSWPQLVSLNLLTNSYIFRAPRLRPPPITTFKSLRTLVALCPRLGQLGIEFDATTLGPNWREEGMLTSAEGAHIPNRLINELCVGESPIADETRVAEYLRHIFAKIKRIYPHVGRPSVESASRYKKWMAVSDSLSNRKRMRVIR